LAQGFAQQRVERQSLCVGPDILLGACDRIGGCHLGIAELHQSGDGIGLNGPRRLTIQKNATTTVKVLVGSTDGLKATDFACGAQKPPHQVMVIHDAKPDATLGTIGNVHTYELR